MEKQQGHFANKKSQKEFNSITEKTTPENQNQCHNVKKEAVDVTKRQM